MGISERLFFIMTPFRLCGEEEVNSQTYYYVKSLFGLCSGEEVNSLLYDIGE